MRLTQSARPAAGGRASAAAITEKVVARGATWGARLRHLRTAIGLAQQDLAAAAGIRQMTLSAIERGDTTPHDATVVALAHAIGVSTRDLEEHCGRGAPIDPVRASSSPERRQLEFRMLDDSLSPWIREGDVLRADARPSGITPVMPELAIVQVDVGRSVIPVAGLAIPVGGKVRLRRGTDAEPVLVIARSVLPVVGWTRRSVR